MTEPNKHRRAEPKRAARPGERARPPAGGLTEEQAAQIREALSGTGSRKRAATSPVAPVLAWLRTTPGLVVAAVLVLGLAVLVRVLASGEEPAEAGPEIPGAVNATYGDRWTTLDGSTYEVSIETLSDLAQGGSDGGSGCLATPPAGTANLRFRVIVTNRSDREAEVPRIDFGTDLGRGGSLVTPLPTFAKSNKRVVITPLVAGAQSCKEAARLGTGTRPKIPAGGAAEFFGTFGPIKVPVGARPTVIYRFYAADGGTAQPRDLLAPYGTIPGS